MREMCTKMRDNGGRRIFYRSKELFLSDHRNTKSVNTDQSKCTAHNLRNYMKLDRVRYKDFFCHFNYDSTTGAFSPDRVAVYCIRELPRNPDELMVKCMNCLDWFHPACIIMTVEEAKSLDRFFC